ncbi:MAG TPA: Ig-like domain-containing protein [Candidatus Gracilibacteria bacterium]
MSFFSISTAFAGVPTINSTTPTNGATAQVVGTNIVLTFNESVYKGSGSIYISDYTAYTHNKTISVDSGEVSVSGNVVTINPTTDLVDNVNYYVTFDSGIFVSDSTEEAYNGADSFSFTVGTVDASAPTLSSHVPTNSATDVYLDSDITLTFNETVVKGSSGNIYINDYTNYTDNRTIAVTSGEVSISGNVVTINPTADLSSNINYYVTFDSGILKDTAVAPNSYDGADSFSFTTGTTTSGGGGNPDGSACTVDGDCESGVCGFGNICSGVCGCGGGANITLPAGYELRKQSDFSVTTLSALTAPTKLYIVKTSDSTIIASFVAQDTGGINCSFNDAGLGVGANGNASFLHAPTIFGSGKIFSLFVKNESGDNTINICNGATSAACSTGISTTIASTGLTNGGLDYRIENVQGTSYKIVSGLTSTSIEEADPSGVPEFEIWALLLMLGGCGYIIHRKITKA